MEQTIIQGIGYLAVVFIVVSFQENNRVRLLLTMLTGVLIFIVHYTLLGAWTAVMMNAIGVALIFVSYKKETTAWAQRAFWPYLFAVSFIVAGIIVAEEWTDFLPVVAQILGIVAIWQTSARAIRFLMVVPRPLWFIYNFTVGSYPGMVAEALITTSVLTGIFRFDIMPLISGRKKENLKKITRWFRRRADEV